MTRQDWFLKPGAALAPGYAILIPVPSDLPVFTELALRNLSKQNLESCLEIVVVPDQISKTFDEAFATCVAQLTFAEKVRQVHMTPAESVFARASAPAITHWLQIVAAIRTTTSSHLLWHDVDALIFNPDLFEHMYARCGAEQLDFLGVQRFWNHELFNQLGYPNIVATWELMTDAGNLRKWPPIKLASRLGTVHGVQVVLDTTVAVQMETPPERIKRLDNSNHFVHFAHVISEYRELQRSRSRYEDAHFRLLFTRLICDTLGNSLCDVPTIEILTQGLTQFDAPVIYASPETRNRYPFFRKQLNEMLTSDLLTIAQRELILSSLKPFDGCLLRNASERDKILSPTSVASLIQAAPPLSVGVIPQ